jgi:hypothetical protein
VDDVAAEIVRLLRQDAVIRRLVGARIGPEGERAAAALPAITYMLTGGVRDDPLEWPTWKVDVWAALDRPDHLQMLSDRIDAVLDGARLTTAAGRRVQYCRREGVWFDLPATDRVRHRSSTWRMVTI